MSDTKPPVRTRSRTPAASTAAASTAVATVATTAVAPPAGGRPRVRSRVGAAGVTNAPVVGETTGNGDTSWMKSGDAAKRAYDAEAVRIAQRNAARAEGVLYSPRRFDVGGTGHEKELVVLDAQLACFMYEHELFIQGSTRGYTYEPCPREHQACPLCEGMMGAKESYYVLFLTVIDLNPGYWKREEGSGVETWMPRKAKNAEGVDEALAFERVLLPVKFAQQQAFFQLGNTLPSLRGLQLIMERNSDKFSPKTGAPNIERSKDNGQFVILTEAEILESFGAPAQYTNPAEGEEPTLLRIENADTMVFDYGRIFRRPDAADLRRRYGGAAPVGSSEANAAASGPTPW
jgi:hypothetical protein